MGSKSEALSNRITILSSGQARRYANSMRGPAQRRFEVRQCSLVSGARAGQANCTGRSQPCCQPASRQRERRLARQRNDARTDSNDYHRLVCRAKPPLARLTESMRPRAANAAKGLDDRCSFFRLQFLLMGFGCFCMHRRCATGCSAPSCRCRLALPMGSCASFAFVTQEEGSNRR